MRRKSLPQKIKMRLQKEVDSHCPFCDSGDVDHFQFHHIDENPENNDPGNLLMLCPTCHSKVTKGDISRIKVELTKKNLVEADRPEQASVGNVVNFNGKVGNAIVGDNNKVTVTVKRQTTKNKYPAGSLGANNDKTNYISYLITRYHEYKEWEVGKENMNYAIFQSGLKKKYRIGKTRTLYNVPEEKFEELASEIQRRIDGTVLASVKRSKDQLKNYLEYHEYLEETKNKEPDSE
jgi:hypothetical protein